MADLAPTDRLAQLAGDVELAPIDRLAQLAGDLEISAERVEIMRGVLYEAGQLLHVAAERIAVLAPGTGPVTSSLKLDDDDLVDELVEYSRTLRHTAIDGLDPHQLEALWRVTFARLAPA